METAPTRSPHISLTKTKPRAGWLIHAKLWTHTHVQINCLTLRSICSPWLIGTRSSLGSSDFSQGTNLCMRRCMPHITSITTSLCRQSIPCKRSSTLKFVHTYKQNNQHIPFYGNNQHILTKLDSMIDLYSCFPTTNVCLGLSHFIIISLSCLSMPVPTLMALDLSSKV